MAEQAQGTVPTDTNPVQVDPAQPVVAAQGENLPVETRDRTREQFEKLLESNQRLFQSNELLRKEIGQRQESNKTFAPIQQVPQAPAQQKVNPQDFVEVDPTTGESFINEQRLRSKMDEIQQRASRAEQVVNSYIKTMEDREIERQNKEAFVAYPELNPGSDIDPNTKFDKTFNQQVRGVLIDSMYVPSEYGGRPLSFKEAADFIKSQQTNLQTSQQAKIDAEDAQKTEAAKNLKQQSSAQPAAQPVSQRAQPEEEAELRNIRLRTRLGDNDALARRLLNTDHTVKDEAAS